MRQSGKVCLLDADPGDPEQLAFEAVRAPARAPEECCSADDDGVAEKQMAWADAIGACVCTIGVAAAILLVVVVAATS